VYSIAAACARLDLEVAPRHGIHDDGLLAALAR
jgi:hypothetical protein